MPKVKTIKGAAKRFKLTKSGKIKRSHASTGHLKTSKNAKRKRQLRKPGLVSSSDKKNMTKALPYG
ncbi:MAG: 50S ribosomal protein L35 [Candidatus Omnitrophota bacterium]